MTYCTDSSIACG